MAKKVVQNNTKAVLARVLIEFDQTEHEYRAQLRRALRLSLIEGALMLQDLLEAAETKTGRDRVAKGKPGTAGRHETGNMIASVSHNGDRLPRTQEVMGSFGWFRDAFEDYFYWQDAWDGGPFAPAMAMERAAIYARERFKQRVIDIARGKGMAA